MMDPNNEFVPSSSVSDDPISLITGRLEFLKYDHSIEQVRTTHLVFPNDVDDFKLDFFSDFGREVVRKYLHVGIVSDACEKPYKQYEVVLVHWPSNIPRSAYEDKSRALLGYVKKIRTIVFALSQPLYNRYLNSLADVPMDELIASAAILADPCECTLIDAKVMSSFLRIVNSQWDSEGIGGGEKLKNYSLDNIDSRYKQMLYLCCANYEVGYHVKKMAKRNWTRIQRRMTTEEKHDAGLNVLETDVFKGGIYELLVLWCKQPAMFRSIVGFLRSINEKKPCLLPSDILDKLKDELVRILFIRKRFACDVCDYITYRRNSFMLHTRTHTGEKPYHCDLCNRDFVQPNHLKAHVRVHRGEEPFKCEFCGRPFPQRIALKYHLASQHYARGNIKYKCYSCHSEFESNVVLKDHIAVHANDKKFQCTTCFRWYANKSDLEKHVLNHTLERPFECHICGRKYVTKHSLQCHYRLHCDKSFECNYCGKSFRQNILKRKHELCIHNVYSSRVAVIKVKSEELGRSL